MRIEHESLYSRTLLPDEIAIGNQKLITCSRIYFQPIMFTSRHGPTL
jgi:hypothetical protein